jgi:hypothetical protein
MISTTPDAPTAASSALLSVVAKTQVIPLSKWVSFRSRRKFQWLS